MAERIQPMDDDPNLSQLVDRVRQTRQPLHLHVDQFLVSVVQTGHSHGHQQQLKATGAKSSEVYPTVASLAGVAGSLPAPLPWTDVRDIARNERLGAKYGRGQS